MKTKQPPKSTHIYIVSCETAEERLLKIGITNDIDKRIRSLQTGNPIPIKLEYIEERFDPQKAEAWLHQQFQAYRVQGEWFRDLSIRDIRAKLMMFLDQE